MKGKKDILTDDVICQNGQESTTYIKTFLLKKTKIIIDQTLFISCTDELVTDIFILILNELIIY